MADRVKRAQRYCKVKAKALAKKKTPKKPTPEAEDAEWTDWIHKHQPDSQEGHGVVIESDPYNGRYRVMSPMDIEWKSISWSRRGHSRCAALVIWHAWCFEERYFGIQSPYDLKAILDGDLSDINQIS
jgi:hypothetical protein